MRSKTKSARHALLLGLALVWLPSGCRHGPALVGTWEGAPQTQEVVRQATKGAAPSPVAQGFANAVVQGLANSFLSVRIQFKRDGLAYYSGNTGALGLPPESDGPWYVIKQQGDAYTVRLGTMDHPVEARIVFREPDKFSLSIKDSPDVPMLFKRVN
jgi:hypothetical protein